MQVLNHHLEGLDCGHAHRKVGNKAPGAFLRRNIFIMRRMLYYCATTTTHKTKVSTSCSRVASRICKKHDIMLVKVKVCPSKEY